VQAIARAKRFVSSFETTQGPAGVEGTKRASVSLLDRQRRIIDQFVVLVRPWQRRAVYRDAVLRRLSGSPGDAAVYAAAVNACDGFIDMPHQDRFRNWNSKAIKGLGR
jgi:hypothetical protein